MGLAHTKVSGELQLNVAESVESMDQILATVGFEISPHFLIVIHPNYMWSEKHL